MEDNELQYSYFGRKQRIKDSIKQKGLTDYYQGFLYALDNNIYPFFHKVNDELSIDEIDSFDCFYSIKKDFISKVLETADELYNQHKSISFYNYEDIFGVENRNDLIHIFRYARLSKKFMNFNFWNTLIDHKNNPAEANWIIED